LTEDSLERAAAQAGIRPFAAVIAGLHGDPTAPPVAVRADAGFYPASMIKTPLAAAALVLVKDGVLHFDDRCEVTAANMTVNDMPSPLEPGYVASVRELIDLMITRSDNVATNMLFDLLGRERATEIVQHRFRLKQTAFYRKLSGALPLIFDPEWDREHMNTHPPADAARLFELIARGEVPLAPFLRDVLFCQQWNNKLSAGLQAGDRFAHKTGDTDEVTHDGGILETANGAAYVVVVYTGMPSSDENNARFGTFMSAVRGEL
jgi:beta-lactamase class A